MSKTETAAAFLLSAGILAFCCFTARRKSEFNDEEMSVSEVISAGKRYKTRLCSRNDAAEYSFYAKNDSYASILVDSRMYRTVLYVYDKNENMIPVSAVSDIAGNAERDYYGGVQCKWDKTAKKYSGVLTYRIKEGENHLRFLRNDNTVLGGSKLAFVAAFPS